jgi:uncharacterized coiled-coil DUF342 family protein
MTDELLGQIAAAVVGALVTLGAAIFTYLAKRKDSDVALRESVNAQTAALLQKMSERIDALERERDSVRAEKHKLRNQLVVIMEQNAELKVELRALRRRLDEVSEPEVVS